MRQPITSPDILNGSVHGGHTIGGNGIGAGQNDQISRMGSTTGTFRVTLPNTAPEAVTNKLIDFTPYRDVEIVNIYIIRNDAGDTPLITVKKLSRLGILTNISTLTLPNTNHARREFTTLSDISRLILGESESDSIRICSDIAIANGCTMYIEFMNRSTLPTP
jgi:hypothetical protein